MIVWVLYADMHDWDEVRYNVHGAFSSVEDAQKFFTNTAFPEYAGSKKVFDPPRLAWEEKWGPAPLELGWVGDWEFHLKDFELNVGVTQLEG